MADFAPADEVEEESPAEDSETDLATDEIEDADESEDAGEEIEDTSSRETVELAWVPENDDPEKPIPEAIEANSRMLQGTVYEYDLESLQDEIEDLQGENERLRERIDSLEGWKGQAVGRLNDISDNVRRLLSVSDLDVKGFCPECNDGELEVKKPLRGKSRVECSNEDCGHIAAALE